MHHLPTRITRAGALALAITFILSIIVIVPVGAQGPVTGGNRDDPILMPGAQMPTFDEATEEILQQRGLAFITRRIAGDTALGNQQAGALPAGAARAAARNPEGGP